MKSTILQVFIILTIVSMCFSLFMLLFAKNDTRFPPMSRATWEKLGEVPENPEPVEKNVPPEVVIQGYTNL
jgi:hypothetical protein|tara:strand:+ start:881 stop:1093 length:213 start_codon:yes stop_codon:yes gene_type:complete